MHDVLLLGAKQQKAKEGYQWFVKNGKENVVHSLSFQEVYDLHVLETSKAAYSCWSKELKYYSVPDVLGHFTSQGFSYEKNKEDESNCQVSKLLSSAFTFQDVTQNPAASSSDVAFDSNWTHGKAYAKSLKFIWALYKTTHLTIGQTLAVEMFAQTCASNVDPSTVDYSVDDFCARINSKFDDVGALSLDSGSGEKYGPAIALDGE